MTLTEQTVIDKLEVLRDGSVQVREAIEILRDGQVISRSFHRRVVSIEDENPDLSFASAEARAVIEAARTPERLAAGLARRAAREANESIS